MAALVKNTTIKLKTHSLQSHEEIENKINTSKEKFSFVQKEIIKGTPWQNLHNNKCNKIRELIAINAAILKDIQPYLHNPDFLELSFTFSYKFDKNQITKAFTISKEDLAEWQKCLELNQSLLTENLAILFLQEKIESSREAKKGSEPQELIKLLTMKIEKVDQLFDDYRQLMDQALLYPEQFKKASKYIFNEFEQSNFVPNVSNAVVLNECIDKLQSFKNTIQKMPPCSQLNEEVKANFQTYLDNLVASIKELSGYMDYRLLQEKIKEEPKENDVLSWSSFLNCMKK
jgi:hypothetical protein